MPPRLVLLGFPRALARRPGDALDIWRDEVADVTGGPIDLAITCGRKRLTRRCNGSCGALRRDERLAAHVQLAPATSRRKYPTGRSAKGRTT